MTDTNLLFDHSIVHPYGRDGMDQSRFYDGQTIVEEYYGLVQTSARWMGTELGMHATAHGARIRRQGETEFRTSEDAPFTHDEEHVYLFRGTATTFIERGDERSEVVGAMEVFFDPSIKQWPYSMRRGAVQLAVPVPDQPVDLDVLLRGAALGDLDTESDEIAARIRAIHDGFNAVLAQQESAQFAAQTAQYRAGRAHGGYGFPLR